jgi:hypothetical protein
MLQPVGREGDHPLRVQHGRVPAQVHVGQEHAEEQEAVAGLDVLPDGLVPDGPRVDAEVPGVGLVDRRLPEEGGDDRDLGPRGELPDGRLQAVPRHLDAGHDDRPFGRVEQGRDPLRDLAREAPALAGGGRGGGGRAAPGDHVHHVPRELDAARPLRAHDLRDDAVDLAEGGRGVPEVGRGDGDALEHPELVVVLLCPVVEEGVPLPLPVPGRAGDHQDRGPLRVGLGGRVQEFQPADHVGGADHAEAPHAGVRVGREPGALLVAGVDDPERAPVEQGVEVQDVVPGHPEDVPAPGLADPPDQVVADARPGGTGALSHS